MIMTKREFIDALTSEYHNVDYDKKEDEKYYFYKSCVYSNLITFIKFTTNLSTIRSKLEDLKSDRMLPSTIKFLIDIFIEPFKEKNDEEIANDEELNKVMKERIYRLDKDIVKGTNDTVKISEVMSSKIKNKKDKTEKKSTTVDFDVFNTF